MFKGGHQTAREQQLQRALLPGQMALLLLQGNHRPAQVGHDLPELQVLARQIQVANAAVTGEKVV